MDNATEIKDENEKTAIDNKEKELEAKIQGQFNEEKWTRVSAKDVSISRFNLLETILNQAIAEKSLEALKESSKKHLEEYEPSVAARYFLGMAALKQNLPDEIVFLKQLLDQFQEISKWAVVEYLSDQMLHVSENRTILRAKATALEKLGKSKEAIPVLEKLARVDRKNPDVALKYADAIIEEDLEKSIQFYKQAAEAYAKSLQFEKLKTVWNKLVELVPEDLQFFKKLERILSGHRQKEILADLYVQLAYHYIKNEDVDHIVTLCKKILEYNPNFVRFKKELVESYRKKYQNHSLLEDFIRYSGLVNPKKNILNAIQDFETNIVFDKDNYVFHRSWGVGKIKDINTTEMIIDFHDKNDHRMEIQMALKSLKPLKEDHFWVYQFEKPEELKKLFEEDVVQFFKILLVSFNGKLSLGEIKLEIVDKYVPAKNWSKWWSKVRTELLKDTLIGISPQKKDIIELYDTPITLSDQLIEKFQAAQSFEDRLAVAIATLKNPDDYVDAIEYIQPFFKESMRSFELDVKLQSLWALDMLHEALGEEDRFYSEELKNELVKDFAAMTVREISNIGSKIKYPEIKKHFARWVKNYHAQWQKIYIELLLQTPIKIHKILINELIETNSNEEILEFFSILRRNAKNYAEIYLWAMKNLIQKVWEIEGLPHEEQLLGFFRLLRNIPKLEPKGTKFKNTSKDILIGSVKDELENYINAHAKNSIRKIVSLFKDVAFLSDHEKDVVLTGLKKISPDQFTESDEAEHKIKAKTLLETLQKSGSAVASQDAINAMQKEMDHLAKVEIPANSKDIGQAQEKGDLRENAEYKAALENQIILQANMVKLENQLKSVTLMVAAQIPTDEVTIGTKVRLKEIKTGDIFVYTILDQWDADMDKGIISYKSPLGQAMLHAKKGSVVVFGTGSGEQNLEVISIEKGLDEEGHLC
jgi:transcription elongation factor GreA